MDFPTALHWTLAEKANGPAANDRRPVIVRECLSMQPPARVHVYVPVYADVYNNIISKTTINRNTSFQVQQGNSWALSALKTARYTTVPT